MDFYSLRRNMFQNRALRRVSTDRTTLCYEAARRTGGASNTCASVQRPATIMHCKRNRRNVTTQRLCSVKCDSAASRYGPHSASVPYPTTHRVLPRNHGYPAHPRATSSADAHDPTLLIPYSGCPSQENSWRDGPFLRGELGNRPITRASQPRRRAPQASVHRRQHGKKIRPEKKPLCR